MALAE
jgi:hypothetical protein